MIWQWFNMKATIQCWGGLFGERIRRRVTDKTLVILFTLLIVSNSLEKTKTNDALILWTNITRPTSCIALSAPAMYENTAEKQPIKCPIYFVWHLLTNHRAQLHDLKKKKRDTIYCIYDPFRNIYMCPLRTSWLGAECHRQVREAGGDLRHWSRLPLVWGFYYIW